MTLGIIYFVMVLITWVHNGIVSGIHLAMGDIANPINTNQGMWANILVSGLVWPAYWVAAIMRGMVRRNPSKYLPTEVLTHLTQIRR